MAEAFKNAYLDVTSTNQAIYTNSSGGEAIVISLRVTNVDGAADALREIIQSVEISAKSILDISEAMGEQAKFSSDIVATLEHIAGIAKETAESAKQSKESASALEYLSTNLNQAVQKFRLAE